MAAQQFDLEEIKRRMQGAIASLKHEIAGFARDARRRRCWNP